MKGYLAFRQMLFYCIVLCSVADFGRVLVIVILEKLFYPSLYLFPPTTIEINLT